MFKLLAQHNLEGSGTPQDPYKIIESEETPEAIHIKGLKSHFLIQGLIIRHLRLEWCSNVVISECLLKNVSIENSHDIMIQKSTIQELTISNSTSLTIRKNLMSPYYFQQTKIEQLQFPKKESLFFMIWSVALSFFIVFTLAWFFGIIQDYILFASAFILIMPLFPFSPRKTIKRLVFYSKNHDKSNIVNENSENKIKTKVDENSV